MVDTHNHILFDIDDGCRNIEESIILLKQMQELGFKHTALDLLGYSRGSMNKKDETIR